MADGNNTQEGTQTPEEREREEYLEERKILVEAERQAAESFDKSLITLSSGALALTVPFIRFLAPNPTALCLLFVAWGGFILALLTILFSILVSQGALRKQRDILDELYRHNADAAQKNRLADVTNALNTASIVLFVGGVLMFALFAGRNLP